jgi:hypothetical protein
MRTMHQVNEYRTVLILAAAVAGAGLMSACATTKTESVESASGHPWNSSESAAYERYLTDQHLPYRPYADLSASDQQDYWNWRAKHPG